MAELQPVTDNRASAPSAYDWYVVAILFATSVLGYVDRVILSFLAEPIKASLALADWQVGAVTGAAFALLYVFGGVFIGRLLDRGRRIAILSLCILTWSLATAASGIATGFITLFVARMFVGVGEAGLNPAAIGIISARFAQDRLQKPIGLFTTGLYVGGGLAMMAGAKLLARFAAGGPYHLPILGEAEPWRLVFLLLALPGVGLALLLWTSVKDGAPSAAAHKASGGDALTFARANRRPLTLLALSIVAWSMNNYGLLNWYPAMLMRSHDMTPAMVASTYGPAFLFAGVGGCLVAHPCHRFLKRRTGDKAAYHLCFAAMSVLSLTTIVGPLMPTVSGAVVMAFVNLFVSALSVTAVFILLVTIVPPALRGRYTGLYMALVNLTGGAFGSVLVGLLTDTLFGTERLDLALSTMALVFGSPAALLMLLASRPGNAVLAPRAGPLPA
ncbi:MFS transporter [Rhizorhabdus sp. FW153]|uniref:MFS transporter n=1 Tax=Rhizorhabdus sp. FW153 TaxID=3400216 RepID=UPI003CEEE599